MDVEAFERCWHDNVRRVTAYAERHVGSEAAYDVVSSTFLTAWRSWTDIPEPALPWLIAAARNHIRNQLRSTRRQRNLADKIALLDQSAHSGPDTVATVIARADAIAGLAALSDQDREALLLIAWDGLSYTEAAKVLGCRTSTLRVRVHRARDRLDLLTEPNTPVLPPLRSAP